MIPRYARWTDDEVAELRRLFPDHTAREISERTGRGVRSIELKARQLGLRKTSEWIAERARAAMADPSHPARRTQWQTGNAPYNKGKPHPARGRTLETMFQPGHRPHTWMPIGSDRTSKEGYLQRKTADTGCTRRDYALIHHLVWRMHGHHIPAGHALVFRDGNKRNFDIHNLELVTRAELMRRNSVHRHGPDIARAYQLVGALNRKINRITQQEHTT